MNLRRPFQQTQQIFQLCVDQAIHGIMISASAKAHELLAIEALNAGKHALLKSQ